MFIGASALRVAGVVGAAVAVIADKGHQSTLAGAVLTRIVQGANAAVIARDCVVDVLATTAGKATVCCADVAVVTVYSGHPKA